MAKKKALATQRAASPKGDKVLEELRAFGLAYPGTHLKSPWPGHKDLAVNDKTFAYLSNEGEPFGISCKLPQSSEVALMLPFCSPTPYGLGKSGWVTAKFPEGKLPPVEMLKQWLDESYRAQAPKQLLKQLDAGSSTPPPGRASPPVKKRKAVAKRTASGSKAKRAQKRVS